MQQTTARQINADTLANQYNLGSLRNDYKLNTPAGCSLFFAVILSLLFVLVPLAFAIPMLRSQMPFSVSMSLIAPIFLLVVAGVGIIFTVGIIIGAVRAYRKRGSALLLYTNGLILLQYQQKQLVYAEALPWQDLALIWHHIKIVSDGESGSRRVHTYRLQNKQGTMFGGDSFKFTMVKLGTIIEQETIPYLWPSTLDAYQRGSLLTFGTIGISSAGLDYNGQHLSWQDMKSVRSDRDGKITIKQHGNGLLSSWAKVPDDDVPNISLLSVLLAFIRDQQGPTAFSVENKR